MNWTSGVVTSSNAERAFGAYIAVGVASALLGTIHLVTELAGEFLSSSAAVGAFYGLDGLFIWVALQVISFGGIGVGGTVLYRRYADGGVDAAVPTRAHGRLLAGVATTVGAVAVAALLAEPYVGTSAYAFVDRFGQTAAVFGIGNPVPDAVVATTVTLTRLLVIAPAFGLVVHGVLQTTLEDVASPATGVLGSALLVVVALTPLTAGVVGRTALGELAYLPTVLFTVAAAVGYGYDRTGSLLVPAAGYALFLAPILLLSGM